MSRYSNALACTARASLEAAKDAQGRRRRFGRGTSVPKRCEGGIIPFGVARAE